VLRSDSSLEPGTPIQCPHCQNIFNVGDVVGQTPGMPRATPLPGASGIPRSPMAAPPRRRRTWLWILLAGLALLVLCCGGVIAALLFFGKDDSLIGTWTLDAAETKTINDNAAVDKGPYTFELQGGRFMRPAKITEGTNTREGFWIVTKENDKEYINFAVQGSTQWQKYEFERIPNDPDRIKIISVQPSSSLPTPCILNRK
jgi:hypothetical protein